MFFMCTSFYPQTLPSAILAPFTIKKTEMQTGKGMFPKTQLTNSGTELDSQVTWLQNLILTTVPNCLLIKEWEQR